MLATSRRLAPAFGCFLYAGACAWRSRLERLATKRLYGALSAAAIAHLIFAVDQVFEVLTGEAQR